MGRVATMRAMPAFHTLRIRLMLDDLIAFGPGKASLLQSIEKTGSIAAAAREIGMSYRRAWLLIEDANRCFREPLVLTATGGPGGGGSVLTETGKRVLHRFLEMEARANAAIQEDAAYLTSLIRSGPLEG